MISTIHPDYILQKAIKIRDSINDLPQKGSLSVDLNLLPITPFIGNNTIKLIIIGQDPTIRNQSERKNISTTLNLNKSGALRNYIEQSICRALNIAIENVYASNLYKYFYTTPPSGHIDELRDHLTPNLNLINEELTYFPNVPIITLGQPVLSLLTTHLTYQKVRTYWGYDTSTRKSDGNFQYCPATFNYLHRKLYPFPHQPSLRKQFYRNTTPLYLEFMLQSLYLE
jgi:hypothetical protein